MVFELRLGVEGLRRRGGDQGGWGRGGAASGKPGENGKGGEDLKAFGHLRVFPALPAHGLRPDWRSKNRRKARFDQFCSTD
jgi:hypothetical protein